MTCPRQSNKGSAEALLAYCARNLDAGKAAELERHLAECSQCRVLAQSQKAVWDALDAWKPVVASRDFDQRLYRRIADESNAGWWRRLLRPAPMFWRPAVSLAAAGVVIAVGLLVRSPETARPQPQVKADQVDIEQVEQALDDLNMLMPLTQTASGGSSSSSI